MAAEAKQVVAARRAVAREQMESYVQLPSDEVLYGYEDYRGSGAGSYGEGSTGSLVVP